MAELRNVSGTQAKRAFEKDDWVVRKTGNKPKGSHLWVMKKPGHWNHLSIPNKPALRIGTLMKLIKAAGLTPEEFAALLE